MTRDCLQLFLQAASRRWRIQPPSALVQPFSQPFPSCLFIRLITSTFSPPPQLQHEKAELEQHLEQEQEFQVNKLMKKIKKMENETIAKQMTLEQVGR